MHLLLGEMNLVLLETLFTFGENSQCGYDVLAIPEVTRYLCSGRADSFLFSPVHNFVLTSEIMAAL